MKTHQGTPVNTFFKLVFGVLLIFSSQLSFAGIYKWVDEAGNVHYGQQRPNDSAAEKMEVEKHAPRDTSSYKRPSLNKDKKEGEGEAEAQADGTEATDTESKAPEAKKPEKKPESRAEKKRRLAACATARKNLATMQSRGRIRSKDKDGNTAYLSQKQKEEKMKKLRELVAKHCK